MTLSHPPASENDKTCNRVWMSYLYFIGALFFTFGSVFFFPSLEGLFQVGNSLFLVGCVVYMLISSLEIARGRTRGIENNETQSLDLVNIYNFLGAGIFMIGCIFFLPVRISSVTAGAWCFVIGSAFFGLGAISSARGKDSKFTARALLEPFGYFAGALFYILASLPYLLDFPLSISTVMGQISGAMFLIGSLLFLFSAVVHYVQANSESLHPEDRRNSFSSGADV